MKSLYDDSWAQLPPVGAKVRRWFGKGHARNWAHWGTVVANVNGDVIVVLRKAPVNRSFYEMIDRIHWDVFQRERTGGPAYQVKFPATGVAA